MKHMRREPHHLDCNASAALGIMDLFLSLPRPCGHFQSRLARALRKIAEGAERLSLRLEPRDIYINERSVEVPFVLQHLPAAGSILEVGSTNSSLALQLASLGYQISCVDVRPYEFDHPNLYCYQGDIAQLSALPHAAFDAAILISTIEHVGLGHYGDTVELTDRAFFDIVARYLRPGGTMLITVPFGQAFTCGWYRVYDSDALARLTQGYEIVDRRYARRLSLLQWQTCHEKELAAVASENLPMNGVAMLAVRVGAERSST